MWSGRAGPDFTILPFCHFAILPFVFPAAFLKAGPLPGYNRTSPRPSPWRGGGPFARL